MPIRNAAFITSWPHEKMFIIMFCFLIISSASSAKAGIIEGVAFTEHGPAPEATVFAYTSYENLVANQVAGKSEKGTKQGQFKIELPPGSFYLVAHADIDNHHFFSYHGVNPITISDEYRWLPLLLVEELPATCVTAERQGISGHVSYKGQAVSGGVVSIYPWQNGKFRGMGLLTNTLDENGDFSFGMETGTYVIVARKKQDIRGIGPVQQGDLFCYPSANPIRVENGQQCSVSVNCYPRDNLDLFLDDDAINPQGRKHDTRRQASLYDLDLKPSESTIQAVTAPTKITGRITDPKGSPLSGLTITAYPSNGLTLFQMHIVRLISNNMGHTDKEGKFTVELNNGGLYYLVAREKVGEAPDRGEYYGVYEGTPNHSITINRGENLRGIDIVVDRIMPSSDHAQIIK